MHSKRVHLYPCASLLLLLAPAALATPASPPPAAAVAPATTPAAPAATALEERSGYLTALQKSGPAPRELSERAARVRAEWEGLARKRRGRLSLSALECFQAGCVITARLRNRNDFDPVAEEMARSTGFRRWNGPRWRSGRIAEGAATEMTWILFGPQAEQKGSPPKG